METPSTNSQAHAVGAHQFRAAVSLQEENVGLVVADGGQGHEHEDHPGPGRAPGPGKPPAAQGEARDGLPAQGEPGPAGQVDQVLDHLEQPQAPARPAQEHSGQGVAVAQDGPG